MGEARHNRNARCEDCAQPVAVACTKANGDVSGDSRSNRVREQSKHRYHAAHGRINTVVRHAQSPQDDAVGKQTYQHHHEHPNVQHKGVPGKPAAVLRYV